MPKARPAAKNAAKSVDDIPVAQRDRYTPLTPSKPTVLRSSRRRQRLFLLVGLVAAVIALGGLTTQLFKHGASNNNPTSTAINSPATPDTTNSDTLLHHFRYTEAPAEQLVSIRGGLQLRSAAAKSYREMVTAARAAGVNINTISAFRSVAEQQRLFFEVKAERAQIATKRAEVSAPPHYSEHHTGYAVDLGDGSNPAANLNQGFENTAAFKWLSANAPRYSFELSFPANNSQGVSYEPWHWRYVGDSDSLETFYKAKNTSASGSSSAP